MLNCEVASLIYGTLAKHSRFSSGSIHFRICCICCASTTCADVSAQPLPYQPCIRPTRQPYTVSQPMLAIWEGLKGTVVLVGTLRRSAPGLGDTCRLDGLLRKHCLLPMAALLITTVYNVCNCTLSTPSCICTTSADAGAWGHQQRHVPRTRLA